MTDEQPPKRFKPTVENMDTVRKQPLATLHIGFAIFFALAIAGNVTLWLTRQPIVSYILGMVLALFMVVGLIFTRFVGAAGFAKAISLGILLQAGTVVGGFLFLFGEDAGFLGFVAQSFFLGYAVVVIIASCITVARTSDTSAEEPVIVDAIS